MNIDDKIYIAGHRGMVGSAICRHLKAAGYKNLLVQSRDQLDLTQQAAVMQFFSRQRPEYVFLCAARVGGIYANNTYPADFIYQNLMIEANIIQAAYQYKVKRLLFLGSSCIYPREAQQPMPESALLSGPLEPTNEPYAIAKIAGIKLCESFNRQYGTDFRSVMPTNLYGPEDNFHPQNSHVIPALIQRIHEAKIEQKPQVEIWGSGRPMREFLHVDDMASACIFVMNLSLQDYQKNTQAMLSHINIGSGKDISIHDLAQLIKQTVGYSGKLYFNTQQPDGSPRKLLDVSRIQQMGWQASIGLQQGLQQTYQWFLSHH